MSIESGKLQAVFSHLSATKVDYALAGEDVAKLLETVEGDVDIILPRSSIDSICEIIASLCDKLDLKCVQLLQHEQRAFYFVIAWIEEDAWRYLRLDFCDDYLRNTRPLMTADELLVGRIKDESSGYYVPAPEKNLLYYLLKKVDKGALSESQFNYLLRSLAACRQDLLPELCRFWPENQSRKILNALAEKNIDGFREMIPELQQSLRASSKPSLVSYAGEVQRLIGRILHPTGLWIAIYGPDGCGKSSVIHQLKPALLPAFRRTAEFHFRPYVGYPEKEGVVTVPDPHGQKPRHPVTSVLKLIYYMADYILGFLLKVWPAKVRSTFIVFDRYYDDLVVDQRRYCYGGPKWLLQWLRPFIPKPDLVFCLDAPAEVLQSRKQEVPFEETARQREIYRDFISGSRNGYVIDASQPVGKVVLDVQNIVLEYMEERTEKRLTGR